MAYYEFDIKKGFATISNNVLRDKKLSLKAKALLALMITFPKYPKFKITLYALAKYCKETVETISKIIKELEAAGYVTRTQIRNSDGTLGYIYEIHQDPIDKDVSAVSSFDETNSKEPPMEKPVLVKPPAEKPVPVEPPQENVEHNKENNNINIKNNKYFVNEENEIKDSDTLDINKIADEIFRLYNEKCTRLKKPSRMTDKRKKLIADLLLDDYSIEDFKIVFEKANSSDFLDPNWADFEWLLDPTYFLRTLEGKYDNHDSQKGKPSYDVNEIEQRTRDKYKNLNKPEPSYNLADIEMQSYDLYKDL